MNRDFVEMLSVLSDEEAEFLVVGAHAMAAHGRPRATGDLDILVRPTEDNAERVYRALATFGVPMDQIAKSEFSELGMVFQIGLPPCRIDVLTEISGVTFDEAWGGRISVSIDGVDVPVLGLAELVKNKKATGRPKDLADVAWLESDE